MASLRVDPGAVTESIVRFLRDQEAAFHRDGAILGLSGGLDSAVVATLAARALGPDKVLALIMPERDSSPESEADAMTVIRQLGLPYCRVDLTPIVAALGTYKAVPLRFFVARRAKALAVRQEHDHIARELGRPPLYAGLLGTRGMPHDKMLNAGHAYIRAKHRIRLAVLYFHAEMDNRLVLGTTNRSEAMTGFVVKWGDNVADVEPILPLYKTQVRQLATYLGVPRAIIDKPPSPDLLPGLTDEYALGLTYELLDQVLDGLEQGLTPEDVASDRGITVEKARYVADLMANSRHMREMPPAPDLPLGETA